jgi:hypothetical protein
LFNHSDIAGLLLLIADYGRSRSTFDDTSRYSPMRVRNIDVTSWDLRQVTVKGLTELLDGIITCFFICILRDALHNPPNKQRIATLRPKNGIDTHVARFVKAYTRM